MYYSSTPNDAVKMNGVISGNRKIFDFRSDTVTEPTNEMRTAMYEAIVGDDYYGEDTLTNELQDLAANLFGKEASLLVPSGTMSNLISVWTHCSPRASACIIGHKSHIYQNEQGGLATIANVFPKVVTNLPDGRLDLDEVERSITRHSDILNATTRLICVENTHNMCGGKAIPMDHIYQLRAIADKHGLKLHLDGARAFNAAEYLQLSVAEIAKPFDSVNLCLSKGLACPIGSLVIGSKDFVSQALHLRKALGGGMRQTGVISAAGKLSLTTMAKRLHIDHANASKLAEGLAELSSYGVVCDTAGVHSNIVIFDILSVKAHRFAEYLLNEIDNYSFKIMVIGEHTIRVVTHYHIQQEHVEMFLDAAKSALEHLAKY